jgi:hypothetical protein
MKIIVGLVLVLVVLAVSCAVSAGMGWLASWVLGNFGVRVSWFVCSVAIFVLGFILRNARSESRA